MKTGIPLKKLPFAHRVPLADLLVQESFASSAGWVADMCKVHDVDIENAEVKRVGDAHDITLDPGTRTSVQYVSARTVDREGEILLPKGAVLDQFKRSNMQIFWNHDYGELIGSDDWIKADDMGILAQARYADTGEGTRPNIVWAMKQQGHLKTNSVGLVPLASCMRDHDNWGKLTGKLLKEWPELNKSLEDCERIITRWLLLEHSDVGVPCNVDATTVACAKGCGASDEMIEKMFKVDVAGLPTGDPKAIEDAKNEPPPEPEPVEPPAKVEPEPPVEPAPAKIRAVCRVVKVARVSTVLLRSDIEKAIADATRKTIDKMRGAV